MNKLVLATVYLLFMIAVTTLAFYSGLLNKYSSILTQFYFANQTSDTIKNESYDKLEEFRRVHREIIDGKRPLKVSINGFTDGGYANKLYAMLTSTVIAILTDSAVIMNDITFCL
jgi:hypothetical protein